MFVLENAPQPRVIMPDLSWLCHQIFECVLSPESFPRCRLHFLSEKGARGIVTKEAVYSALRTVHHDPDAAFQILVKCQICLEHPHDKSLVLFPGKASDALPSEYWILNGLLVVYLVRVFVATRRRTPFSPVFLHSYILEVMEAFQLEIDERLFVWKFGLVFSRNGLEVCIKQEEHDTKVWLVVRGEEDSEPKCLLLLSKIQAIGWKTAIKVSPGSKAEWRIGSGDQARRHQPLSIVYKEEDVCI